MSKFLFEPPEVFTIAVSGEDRVFPLRRTFCVGRNYVAHAVEMGGEVDREAPWYFTKSASHAVRSGAVLPYPAGTENFHHEMELYFAIGSPVFRASRAEAAQAIFGYGAGLDMTRRDRQQDGKDHRRPWSLGKDFEGSAVLAPMTKAADFGEIGSQRIHLEVNGAPRQDATLADMVWCCDEVVAHLSHYYHLGPGDVVLTGTPAGVGPVGPGDRITGGIDGLAPVALTVTEPQ